MKKNATEASLEQAREILRREADGINNVAKVLDDDFNRAVEMIFDCEGSVVVTGIGKAGIVGQKISATLASTGTPSHFLHAAEAVHGDLGRLRQQDICMVLSHSGASSEIVRLIVLLKKQGVRMIGMTGDRQSELAKHSEVVLWLGNLEEVCPLGLAPSTSTTCMLALGDALALTIMQRRNFQAEDYAKYHPGGSLGRQLVTVEQAALFSRGKALPVAVETCTVQQALHEAETGAALRHGCILLVDKKGKLSGLLTDGDLRRGLERLGDKVHTAAVADIMTANPKVVRPDTLASEAMAVFHKHRIDEIPVVDDNGCPVGLIDVQDVVALEVVR